MIRIWVGCQIIIELHLPTKGQLFCQLPMLPAKEQFKYIKYKFYFKLFVKGG